MYSAQILADGSGMAGWIASFQTAWNTGAMWNELTAARVLLLVLLWFFLLVTVLSVNWLKAFLKVKLIFNVYCCHWISYV